MGAKLWEGYILSLRNARLLAYGSAVAAAPAHRYREHVFVPTVPSALPVNKFAAKVNLGQMTTDGMKPGYLDPLLVAYKSSIQLDKDECLSQ
jgi:hypothetical protein